VLEVGNYEALMSRNDEFAQLFRTHGGGDNTVQEEANEGDNDVEGKGAVVLAVVDGTEKKQEQAEEAAAGSAGTVKKKDGGAPRVLMTTEERATGGLSWRTWWYYLNAFGGVPWVAAIVCSIAVQMAIRIYNDYWLSGWTDDRYNQSTYFYMAIYGQFNAQSHAIGLHHHRYVASIHMSLDVRALLISALHSCVFPFQVASVLLCVSPFSTISCCRFSAVTSPLVASMIVALSRSYERRVHSSIPHPSAGC
jgi:hypothetical protein